MAAASRNRVTLFDTAILELFGPERQGLSTYSASRKSVENRLNTFTVREIKGDLNERELLYNK